VTRTDPALVAWQAPATEPPATASAAEVSRAALEWAVLAPSGHNTQPWRFRLTAHDDATADVELYADRRRRLPVVDPDDRALVISCGAALGFLTAVLSEWGLDAATRTLPDTGDPDLLAVVTVDVRDRRRSTSDQVTRAILARRTNRNPYDDTPLDDTLITRLAAAAADNQALLRFVTHRDETTLAADLVAEGDRIQMHDPAFRRELAEWVHHNHSAATDGVRGQAFGIPDLVSHLGPFVVRTFDQGERQGAKDRNLVLTAPALAVLATTADTLRDWIAAGRALAAVLVTATSAGLSVAFMNQPVEVPALRPRLADGLQLRMTPQLLFRIGRAPEIPPQPRHPLDEVLTTEIS
jgi:hypothetical protein